MKKLHYLLLFGLIFLACENAPESHTPPNIIFILADDLGYGEVGAYGQEIIQTPNIDALAASGMKFTRHYTGAPVCAPSRYIFLTGLHAGHAYIRGNDEWNERGDVWNYRQVFEDPTLEGQRPIPSSTVTLGKILQDAGYKTGIMGKWGLGAPESEGIPNLQGFDYFYGYNCQRQAHNLYPGHLWEDTTKVLLNNELIPPGTKLDPGADPNEEESYAKYNQQEYAPTLIHEKALSFIQENKDHPFFMYYASPLPHLPLQAPKEWVDKYRKILGEEEPYIGDQGYFPTRYPRATYAAMISYLDHQVGELVTELKEQGIYENTVIIFTSDNGPTYTGGVDFEFFNSSAPFANGYGRTKGFVYEGGVRIPLIVSWPGHIEAGSTNDHLSTFYDMLPTITDIAGIAAPDSLDGISFKPSLVNKAQPEHEFLYWEFPSYNGQQAVRMGNWKGVRKNIRDGNMKIELYDLENDAEEQNDLSAQHPDIVRQMESIMVQEHEPAENEKFRMKELGDE